MPSARPRLVEEGTPLDQQSNGTSGSSHHREHHMEDATNGGYYSQSNHSQRTRTHAAPAGAASSLALAAGLPSSWSTGNLPRMSQTQNHSSRSHRYVVGGDEAMDMGSDHLRVDHATTPTDPSYATPFDNRPHHPNFQRSYQQPQLPATPVSELFGPVQPVAPPPPHQQRPAYASRPYDANGNHGYHRRHSDGNTILPPPHQAIVPDTNNTYNNMPAARVPWTPSQHAKTQYQPPAPGTGPAQPPPASLGRHHYKIGDETSEMEHQPTEEVDDVVERMYGVEDHSIKPPLVVIDGANLAFAYTEAMTGAAGGNVSSLSYHKSPPQIEPDVHGIQVAVNYFQSAGCRVLVVLPTWWLRLKPRAGDTSDNNAKMMTPQLEILHELKAQGVLVTSPPKDDDDAYALTIARREDVRARRSPQQQGPSGFVLSNDMFRDAMARDATGQLTTWLTQGNSSGGESYPGRISYAFCDMGSMDGYGDPELDIVPNPKHPLVMQIEAAIRAQFK